MAEVFKWVDTYGGKICAQMRRMGSSPDWSRCACGAVVKVTFGLSEIWVLFFINLLFGLLIYYCCHYCYSYCYLNLIF